MTYLLTAGLAKGLREARHWWFRPRPKGHPARGGDMGVSLMGVSVFVMWGRDTDAGGG